MGREAFVTLATNDTYCKGAVVLAHSLRKHNTKKEIVVMITPQVSNECKLLLELLFDQIVCVNILDSKDDAHLALLKRPELGITFTKIHCWNLAEYDKCVFMDADTMALMNIDDLFDREEISAAPDAGWPDMFNSGVFVYKPSRDTYLALIKLADDEGSFDGGDQGLLNTYFNTWATSDSSKRLSFLYNMHSTSTYTYCPAFARFGKDTKVVHFIGSVKPWHHKYSAESDTVQLLEGPGIHEQAYLLEWWHLMTEILNRHNPSGQAWPELCRSTATGAADSSEVHAHARETRVHHQQWQNDLIDFVGVDRFQNIQQKLDKILTGIDESPSEPEPASATPPVTPIPLREVAPFSATTDRDAAPFSGTTDRDAAPSPGPPDQEVVEPETLGTVEESAEAPVPVTRAADLDRWKRGTMDFMGSDSSDNIMAKIDSLLISSEPSVADDKTQAVTAKGATLVVPQSDPAIPSTTDGSSAKGHPSAVQPSSGPAVTASTATSAEKPIVLITPS